jgi:hypothetical protein
MPAKTAPAADLREFALRTTDAAWIARNNGVTDENGRVTVQVPASQIAAVKFAGNDWLRHKFADCPRDIPNALVMCPAKWVPGTADRFTFQREDMRAEFIKRAAKR